MLTLSLPTTCSDANTLHLFQREQSTATRIAYKRFQENKSEKETRAYLKTIDFKHLDSYQIQCAILEAKAIFKQCGKGVVFGGKKNQTRRAKELITNEEWKNRRIRPFTVQGTANRQGNRYFKLDQDKLIFQMNRTQIMEFQLPKLRSNYKEIFKQLEYQTKKGLISLSIRVTQDKVYFSFDESKLPYYQNKYKKYTSIEGRSLGIDLNPEEIGIAVVEGTDVIHTQVFVFSDMAKDKKKHETLEIADTIAYLARHYQVEKIILEDLSLKLKNHNKGKRLNRRLNNEWYRDLFINKIKRICNCSGVEVVDINPAYTSFIGQIEHPDMPSSTAAATEIARRGATKYIKGTFYPALITQDRLAHRWKEKANFDYSSWVELFREFKTRSLRWRVSWRDVANTSTSSEFKSRKSGVTSLQKFSGFSPVSVSS